MVGLYAFKRLSLREIQTRWDEYQKLPLRDRQVLTTYAVTAALFVAILVGLLIYSQAPRSASSEMQPLDKLGLLIELTR